MITLAILYILEHWFESPVLQGTLATDAVVGAMLSPYSPGSGWVGVAIAMTCRHGNYIAVCAVIIACYSYVLLHHVMGGVGGQE